jgi:hypothetical protein
MSKKTDPTLQKCDALIARLTTLKKALQDVTQVQSMRTPMPSLGVGWSMDPSSGAFHHSTHGVISTSPHPEGGFDIRHGGTSVGRVGDLTQAGARIRSHVNSLNAGTTGMHDRPSPNMPGPTKMGKPTMDKSDYGKFKGGSQYDAAANAKRKMTNVGTERFGNQSTKSYTHNKAFAQKAPSGAAGPVKQYTPEQIAAVNEARKLKKNAEGAPWDQHGQVPNADVEVQKVQRENPAIAAEHLMPDQLAAMMHSKAMLNPNHRQPTAEDMIMAGERMGLGANRELIKAQDEQWGGSINNWLVEAQKPIASRFSSEEEEAAYWDSIKVNGSSRDDYGF